MLCAVENKNISTNRHCCNDVGILRLISCTVDFSFVYNLLCDGEATFKSRISSEFYIRRNRDKRSTSSVFVVVCQICTGNRELNVCKLKVVLISSGSVGADQEAMRGVIFAGFPAVSIVL